MVKSSFVESQATSKPIGVLKAFSTGFDRVAARPFLIIPPLALDLFLWLGPHLRISTIVSRVAASVGAVEGVMAEQASLLQKALEGLGESFNLLSALSTVPIGIPSLMAGRMPLDSPLGPNGHLEISDPAQVILLWLLISALGLGLGAFYQVWIAGTLAPDSELASGWSAAVRMIGFAAILSAGTLVVGTSVVLAATLATLLLPLIGAGVMFLGFSLLFWLGIYLIFTPHGIVRYNLGVIRAMLESFAVVRWNLLSTVSFLVLAFSTYWGLNVVWELPDASSWFSLLAVIGHAFVSTTLLAGSYAYYQGHRDWLQQARSLGTGLPKT